MTSQGPLRKLTSKYNLRVYKNDRKFYKKYSYKLGYYVFSANYENLDYFEHIYSKRVYAERNNMYIRRERNKINVYAASIDDLEKYIEEFPEMDYVELGYFPEDIPVNVKLRKNEPEFPYEVKLRRQVNKETLLTFVDTHKENMWMNKDSRYELFEMAKYSRHTIFWSAVDRTKTWTGTTYRFKDQDVKNLFLFTFGEYVSEETLYKKESTDE